MLRESLTKYYCDYCIGAKTGYMNTIKMYYQGGVPGDISKAVFSKTPRYLEMYDMTYRFAKRKLILEEK